MQRENHQHAKGKAIRDYFRKTWKVWIIITVAAAVLAVGLELLQNSLIPPIYQGGETELHGADWAEIEARGVYMHPSGRLAYKEVLSPKRLSVGFVVQFLILSTLFPLGLGKRLLRMLRDTGRSVRKALGNRRQIFLHTALFLIMSAAGFFLIRLWAVNSIGKTNEMVYAFCIFAGVGLAAMVMLRRVMGEKPEIVFVCIALLLGGQMSFLLPDVGNYGWDDTHHYQHALYYSNLGRVHFTQQDMITMGNSDRTLALPAGKEREELLAKQDEANQSGAVYATEGVHMTIGEFWMATHGLGLFLARVLHLNYWLTWSMGRLTGLIAYTIIGYFAIKRLRSGRMILCTVLLLPQQIFLASCYSYDPGVTGLTALGLSYCFAQWQEPDRKISIQDQVIMLGALFLGCFAKQVYFPMLVIPMLLPKEKFGSPKERKRFQSAALGVMALLVISFVVPFVLGDGAGDQRGGEASNAFEQVRFILTHPLDYAYTLLRFLGSYLYPANAAGFITFFAYFQATSDYVPYLMLMTAATFTDKRKEDVNLGTRVGVRAFSEAMLAVAVVLVATSLYVAYTTVGANYIAGCQPRYLAPLLFPAMMMLGSAKIQNGMKDSLYNGLLFAGIGYIGFATFFRLCISIYG